MKAMTANQVEQIAASLYDPSLAYHNFDHVESALREAELICQSYHRHGLPIDDKIVMLALLFHDAGYHEDHASKGFDSKEAYSAHLAKQQLAKLGLDDQLISSITQAIMSTHKDAVAVTNEDKVVRLADVANIAGDYQQFITNTRKLKLEFESMNHRTMSWEDWKQFNLAILECYLKQDLDQSGLYQEANGSSFIAKARSNLDRLKQESS
ncbi:MAG TPA: hypothetical protein VLF41_01510 [Candidatus Nanoarchaeia archaeon]|nr:hypothetical protein [Candidatus Nanoarchaeia archaeon]